jgi:hypothetical protein
MLPARILVGVAVPALLLAAAGAAPAGTPSCFDKARGSFAAAKKQDDAAYKVAVGRCQTTYPPATKMTQFMDCIGDAGTVHREHRKKLLQDYKQAGDVCAAKYGSCLVQAWSEYKRDVDQQVFKLVAHTTQCMQGVQFSQVSQCVDAANAAFEQATAASDRKLSEAEKRCLERP